MPKELAYHENANIFPLLQGSEFDDLVADIQQEGLHEPIVLHEGKILDGRNRYRACRQASIEPRFETYKGKRPLQYVISLNLKRRHLTESQRAMVAARIVTLRKGQHATGARAQPNAVTQQEAALNLKVGHRTVQDAQRVLAHGTKNLIAAIDSGHIRIDSAKRLVELPEKFQDKIVALARDADPDEVPALIQEESRRIREADLKRQAKSWTKKSKFAGPYAIIYADPPWQMSSKGYSPSSSSRVITGATTATLKSTLSAAEIGMFEIQGKPIQEATLQDAILFLWVPAGMAADALAVCAAWGFEHKGEFVWYKTEPDRNSGTYNRIAHELLFVAKKGDFPPPNSKVRALSVIAEPSPKDKTRPEVFYEIIESAYKDLKRIELFGKAPRKGWDRWGLEGSK